MKQNFDEDLEDGRQNRDDKQNLKFLLQLWLKKDGVMLYERQMSHPPVGWGINGNSFFYCDHKVQNLVYHFYCVTLEEEGDVSVYKYKLEAGLKTDERQKVKFKT